MQPHWFEVFDPEHRERPGEWCKHCNCTEEESDDHFDLEEFIDYVAVHGFGSPNDEGVAVGLELLATGDDVATAAAEVVARDLVLPEKLSAPQDVAAAIGNDLRENPHRWTRCLADPHAPACGLLGHIACYVGLPVEDSEAYAAFVTAVLPVHSIPAWNDDPSRTVEDVIALCEKVAQS